MLSFSPGIARTCADGPSYMPSLLLSNLMTPNLANLDFQSGDCGNVNNALVKAILIFSEKIINWYFCDLENILVFKSV